ncbi:MAG: hypothetical protein KA220_07590 [Phenylobacterium sp.]|nr:hypothetical protein [Phenylobacterium sp.]MBP8247408.1 hypothetical protein [Phenylobacterium sp.]
MKERTFELRTWLIVGAVVLAVGGGAYLTGYGLEHAARKQEVAAAEQKFIRAEARSQRLEAANQLLIASTWVYRSGVALDQRNFGVANDAMVNAVASLKAVRPETSGQDPAAITAIQKEAAAIKIAVATDLGAQRARVLQLATGLSRLALAE